MTPVHHRVKDLAEKAKALHQRERRISLESTLLIGELHRLNAAAYFGMCFDDFVKYLELTEDQYWKRSQVARTIRFFPEVKAMLECGETCLSHVAMVAAKITQANADVILGGIRSKKRREVEALLSRVTPDGELSPREGQVELRLKLKDSEWQILSRAREVLAAKGKVKTEQEVIVQALAELIERRDPTKKAERARQRAEQTAARQVATGVVPSPGSLPEKAAAPVAPRGDQPAARQVDRSTTGRPAIPAALNHAVRLRDGGRCVHVFPDGSRCPEISMVEIDHIVPWCRSRQHRLEDLRLVCRSHNRLAAEATLGHAFMAPYTEPVLPGSTALTLRQMQGG